MRRWQLERKLNIVLRLAIRLLGFDVRELSSSFKRKILESELVLSGDGKIIARHQIDPPLLPIPIDSTPLVPSVARYFVLSGLYETHKRSDQWTVQYPSRVSGSIFSQPVLDIEFHVVIPWFA